MKTIGAGRLLKMQGELLGALESQDGHDGPVDAVLPLRRALQEAQWLSIGK